MHRPHLTLTGLRSRNWGFLEGRTSSRAASVLGCPTDSDSKCNLSSYLNSHLTGSITHFRLTGPDSHASQFCKANLSLSVSVSLSLTMYVIFKGLPSEKRQGNFGLVWNNCIPLLSSRFLSDNSTYMSTVKKEATGTVPGIRWVLKNWNYQDATGIFIPSTQNLVIWDFHCPRC